MTSVDDEAFLANVQVPPHSTARIFRDPSVEAETEAAFAACAVEDGLIMTGTTIALFGGAVAGLCILLLVFGSDSPVRTCTTLLASSVVAAYGIAMTHSADLRRGLHVATLRSKRPYVVTFEAEQALRRIMVARAEARSLVPTLATKTPAAKAATAAAATMENLHGEAWRLIRALDASTPTWRFDDPSLVNLVVTEKARRGEHAALLELADQAEKILDGLQNPPEEPEAATADEETAEKAIQPVPAAPAPADILAALAEPDPVAALVQSIAADLGERVPAPRD